jgi:hypothetical protein
MKLQDFQPAPLREEIYNYYLSSLSVKLTEAALLLFLMSIMVYQEWPGRLEPQVQLELLDQQEPQVQLELLDQQELPVWLISMKSKESLS